MHQSIFGSRQTVNKEKGNHRRKNGSGKEHPWGCKKYLQHSFVVEEELFKHSSILGVVLIARLFCFREDEIYEKSLESYVY